MNWIVLATEDEVSECVGIQLAIEAGLKVSQCIRRGGNGYLRSRIKNFCEIAKTQPVLLLTDLDRVRCPPALITAWFGKHTKPEQLIFRVAVREIEAWLLADHDAILSLFGRRMSLPDVPDDLEDPKAKFLHLARNASRAVRDDLVVSEGSIASQGLGYNSRLSGWIRTSWSPARAATRSPSLSRARDRLRELAT